MGSGFDIESLLKDWMRNLPSRSLTLSALARLLFSGAAKIWRRLGKMSSEDMETMRLGDHAMRAVVSLFRSPVVRGISVERRGSLRR